MDEKVAQYVPIDMKCSMWMLTFFSIMYGTLCDVLFFGGVFVTNNVKSLGMNYD
jgi:hypothetical protein